MKPTRRTQPYRKGKARLAGQTLYAMLAGRAAHQANPQDAFRTAAKRRRKRVRPTAY